MGQSRVKSAERALEVLRFLGERPAPVFAATISRQIGLPKSSTYHLLNVMRDRGFVAYYPDARAWGLGAVARSIGTGHLRRDELAAIARPTLEALATRTGASASLAVLRGPEVVIVTRTGPAGERAARGIAEPGVRLPAHLSGFGRAILIAESPGQVDALFPVLHSLPLGGRATPGRPAELHALLREQAASGVGMDHGEVAPGIITLAAAILDHLGAPTASIGVSFVAALRPAPEREAIGDAVRAAAAGLSSRLGHHPPASLPVAISA